MNKAIFYKNLFDFDVQNHKASELIYYNFSKIIGSDAKLKYIKDFDHKFYNILENPVSSHFSFFELIKTNEFQKFLVDSDKRSVFLKDLFTNQTDKLNLGLIFSEGKEKLDSYLKFISDFDFENPENIEDQEIMNFLSSKSDIEYFEMIFENQEFLNSMIQNPDFLYFLDNKEISDIFSNNLDLNLILKNDMQNLTKALSDPLIEDFGKAAQTNNLGVIISASVFGSMLLASLGGFIFYSQVMKSKNDDLPSTKIFYHKENANIKNNQDSFNTFSQFKDFFLEMTDEKKNGNEKQIDKNFSLEMIDEKKNGNEKQIDDFILFQPETCNKIYSALNNEEGFSSELKEEIVDEILSKSNITNMLYQIFNIKLSSSNLIFDKNKINLKDFLNNLEKDNPEIKKFNQEFRKQIFEKLDSFKSLDSIIQTKMTLDNSEIFIQKDKPRTLFSLNNYKNLDPEGRFYLVAINDNFRSFVIDSLDKMFKNLQDEKEK